MVSGAITAGTRAPRDRRLYLTDSFRFPHL